MGYCIACDRGLPEAAIECVECGAPVPDAPTAPTAPAGPSMGLAVAALILNVVIWPGLGSLIGGRMVGWIQGFGFLFGIFTIPFIIGFPIALVAWISGIVSGVNLINESTATQNAQVTGDTGI